MPTPIAPGVIRVQAVLQGKSGLPEDRFVSTFHFRTANAATAEAANKDRALGKVRDFYTLGSLDGLKVSDFFSAAVARGVGAMTLKAYHLGDPEPRAPYELAVDLLGTAGASLPAEVAVCLSFSGERANLPRERGRVYVGPLTTSAVETDASLGRVRANAQFMGVMVASGQRMMGDQTDSDLARWVVYSPTNNSSTLVRQGFVDDALDTQRRRGEAPLNRSAWTGPPTA